MRILGILFYTAVLVLIGLVTIVFVVVFSFGNLQPQCLNAIDGLLVYIQNTPSARLIIGLSGFLLIFISFSFAQLILARFQREKTIAFTTSSGEVTIALGAIEDLIRRITNLMPEIKELRPDVRASKKGSIIVDLRAVLRSEANIPELTARLQDITKAKIQEVLGLEEQIIIRIHIIKIISNEEKDKRKRDSDRTEPAIPYGGYGRV